MKVLFAEIDTETAWGVASLGPAFLTPLLRRAGHEVVFFRAGHEMSPGEFARRVEAVAPDLLGLSLTTRQWLRARVLVGHLRDQHEVPVIAGGLHPTFSPLEVLASPGFDYVCLGEGELAMRELVERLHAGRDASGIRNIWKRGAERPTLRPPFEPIDELPFLARDLIDEFPGVVHMATQRGCPFPCTYCAARKFADLYPKNSYGRRRSIDNVFAELAELADKTPLRWVSFLDDTFTIHHPWVREFCHRYPSEVGADFGILARVETVTEQMIHSLAAAGCKLVNYGVESGSERIRREVMRRRVTNQRFEDVLGWTRDAGIRTVCNYMLGLPGETRDDLEQTLALAARLPSNDLCYYVFYPYPGTALYRVCVERGLLPAGHEHLPANHRASTLTLKHLTCDDIAEYYDRFTALREQRLMSQQGQDSPDTHRAVMSEVNRYARTN